ncbi:ferritin family protein [Acidocella sp.]|uniref:ferritin family protein n=1 Tax=Acidocella sp. TaxID=50710 RepID=UPI002610F9E2|nr:ferritin family protein [Acidocella sp.]
MDATAEAMADHNARNWTYAKPGRIRIGSPEHFAMLTELLGATYNPYKPAVLDWPVLTPETRARVIALPIWDIAVQSENKAGARIEFFAQTVKEKPLRQALLHMAAEERRHREVLSRLVAAYDIPIKPDEEYVLPRDAEWAFLVTGYSECIDSFFAYGLFEMARRSGFFPPSLVETFEPVIQEEGRHILFFTNFVAWHRANLPWWRRPFFEIKVAAVYLFLGWERLGLVKDVDGLENADANFTMRGTESIVDQLDPARLIDICLEQDRQRMAGYDERLVRPTTIPRLARIARLFMRPKKP